MQRERIHFGLSFHYEHRLRAGSRTGQEGKLWTNTARFKPADLSPLLKGEIKWGCGVFVVLGGRDTECVCVHATKTQLMMLPISEALTVGSRISRGPHSFEFVKLFTSEWREWRVPQPLLFSISNVFQTKFSSSFCSQASCGFISQRLVSTVLKGKTFCYFGFSSQWTIMLQFAFTLVGRHFQI